MSRMLRAAVPSARILKMITIPDSKWIWPVKTVPNQECLCPKARCILGYSHITQTTSCSSCLSCFCCASFLIIQADTMLTFQDTFCHNFGNVSVCLPPQQEADGWWAYGVHPACCHIWYIGCCKITPTFCISCLQIALGHEDEWPSWCLFFNTSSYIFLLVLPLPPFSWCAHSLWCSTFTWISVEYANLKNDWPFHHEKPFGERSQAYTFYAVATLLPLESFRDTQTHQ